MKRRLPFVLAALVPFLLLFGMAADQVRVVRFGTPVRVRVIPVDPMSLFSGEYARLSFEFTTLNAERLAAMGVHPPDPAAPGTNVFPEPDPRFRKGRRAWVVLAPGTDNLWHPVRLEGAVPKTTKGGEVAVRGEVKNFFSYWSAVRDNTTHRPTGEQRWSASLTLHTGLESFYVPQGESARIERVERNREVAAEIAVLPGGRAAVRKLFVEGREVRF